MPYGKPCLFVAPKTDLYYAAEEAEVVVNILGANLLNGDITVSQLLRRVREVQPKLIIISSHGSQEGILLGNGFIGADLLRPILNLAPIECVYLNTCESLDTATAIHNELPVAFIATIQRIPDLTAYVTMSAFAHHMSLGKNYVTAWFNSKAAGNVSSIFLPPLSSELPMSPEERKPQSNGDLKGLQDEMYRLSAVVYGDEKWPYPGILPTITKLERQINQVRVLGILLVVLIAIIGTYLAARGLIP